MRVLIATVQVPFVRGGAEMHAEGLQAALMAAGHQVEQIKLPFEWYPPERILDLTWHRDDSKVGLVVDFEAGHAIVVDADRRTVIADWTTDALGDQAVAPSR